MNGVTEVFVVSLFPPFFLASTSSQIKPSKHTKTPEAKEEQVHHSFFPQGLIISIHQPRHNPPISTLRAQSIPYSGKRNWLRRLINGRLRQHERTLIHPRYIHLEIIMQKTSTHSQSHRPWSPIKHLNKPPAPVVPVYSP